MSEKDTIRMIACQMIDKHDGPFVLRKDIEKFSFKLLNRRVMANLDCQKLGPPRFRAGKFIGYWTDDRFVEWMVAHFTRNKL